MLLDKIILAVAVVEVKVIRFRANAAAPAS
jgi:hypothetical protein